MVDPRVQRLEREPHAAPRDPAGAGGERRHQGVALLRARHAGSRVPGLHDEAGGSEAPGDLQRGVHAVERALRLARVDEARERLAHEAGEARPGVVEGALERADVLGAPVPELDRGETRGGGGANAFGRILDLPVERLDAG